MAQKQKLFRIDVTLAGAFEAFCRTRGIKQEHAAEAALFALIAMSPDERERLFVALGEWKANKEAQGGEPQDVAAAVAAALRRRRTTGRRARPAQARRPA
ncbi:MAG: hypothetical protein B1H04_04175 [Planctomycetales bacterium 4484_123]|nr:MAG: hypothetical protein B1H04_04175 [Planctomycetales bacterium 4484_123]